MAIVATYKTGNGRPPITVLSAPPHQRAVTIGDEAMLIGFPASQEGTPWSKLDVEQQSKLIARVIDGSTTLKGGWILLADCNDELVVRTDRFGTRPLFWRADEAAFTVADDIWSLLDPLPELDPHGIADFLLVGHHLRSNTIFKGVSVTEADATLSIGVNSLSTHQHAPPQPLTIGQSLDDAVDLLESALTQLLVPYSDLDRILMPISGGLDSRVLLALAVEQGFDVCAWTFVAVPKSQEEEIAKVVTSTLGVPHTVSEKDVDLIAYQARGFIHATSGQLSLEHTHSYGGQPRPPAQFKVAASGIFGDVVCGGSMLLSLKDLRTDVARARVKKLVNGFDPEILQRRLPGVPGWSECLFELVYSSYACIKSDLRWENLITLRNRPRRFTVFGSIANRPQIDYITPFLDEELVRVCYSLDDRWQRDSVAYRKVIERRWPTLATIPWERTGLPVTRYPGRFRGLLRDVRRRLPVGRPTAFTDPLLLYSKHHSIVERAVNELPDTLGDIGVDLAELLNDFPEGTPYGRRLRLRAATLYLTLAEAGFST